MSAVDAQSGNFEIRPHHAEGAWKALATAVGIQGSVNQMEDVDPMEMIEMFFDADSYAVDSTPQTTKDAIHVKWGHDERFQRLLPVLAEIKQGQEHERTQQLEMFQDAATYLVKATPADRKKAIEAKWAAADQHIRDTYNWLLDEFKKYHEAARAKNESTADEELRKMADEKEPFTNPDKTLFPHREMYDGMKAAYEADPLGAQVTFVNDFDFICQRCVADNKIPPCVALFGQKGKELLIDREVVQAHGWEFNKPYNLREILQIMIAEATRRKAFLTVEGYINQPDIMENWRQDVIQSKFSDNAIERIQDREKASDRIIHIENELVHNVPEVPRLCESMELAESKYVQVDEDCKLYVEQEGSGEPIVLLHGGPGATHHYFHPHFSKLADSARVISYDQRGCGLSNRNAGDGYSIDQAVDDLENLRKALGVDRWTVLGHSYGGLLAQNYAKKYPQSCKGLVLTCASPGIMNLTPGRDQNLLSEEESTRIQSIHDEPDLTESQKVYNAFLNGDWKRQNLYRPTKEEAARFALYEWDNDSNYRSNVAKEADGCDLEGAFEGCPIPTLIAEGGQDMTWNTDKPGRFQQNHPNARMIMFENSAHNPFQDEPERFFDELRGFLGGLLDEPLSDLSQWEAHVAAWEDAKRNSPDSLIASLFGDPECYQKIVDAYSSNWLDQLKYSSSFREVGFAFYIAEKYSEALTYFQKMEASLGTHPFEIATALIWQGHMLDLLGRRDEAIAVYRKVEDMGIDEEITLEQFGLTYSPSPYATQRIQSPFARIDLV